MVNWYWIIIIHHQTFTIENSMMMCLYLPINILDIALILSNKVEMSTYKSWRGQPLTFFQSRMESLQG